VYELMPCFDESLIFSDFLFDSLQSRMMNRSIWALRCVLVDLFMIS